MIRRRRSAGHGSLRTITPTRAAFARPGPGGYPFPGVIARMQSSDSLIPIGLGSGRPLPSAYPGARATRSNEGLPGVRAVLFQRAVVVDPAGCGALLAHGAGTAVAFRLYEALGTQEDVVSRLQGLRPTRSRTYASATALPRSPQGSLPAWVGWPLTGRGSHPLDDTQGFMTYSSIPLDRPAWPHRAPTPSKPWSTSVAHLHHLGRGIIGNATDDNPRRPRTSACAGDTSRRPRAHFLSVPQISCAHERRGGEGVWSIKVPNRVGQNGNPK